MKPASSQNERRADIPTIARRISALPPSPEEPDGVPEATFAGGAPDESKSSAAAVSVSSSAESSLTVVFPNLFDTYVSQIKLAGVPGFEPGLSVLETDVLTVDTIPLCHYSLRFLVRCVLAATAAELAEFKTLCSRLLVLGRCVIATFAINALQHDVVTRHSSVSF